MDIDVIMNARKSLLFTSNECWIKRKGDPKFDVTMGSFDGAEICELVGLFILGTLGNIYGHDLIGLYRDEGLACFENIDGHTSDRIRKHIIKIFKECDLKITIDTHLKVTNFLDVTFNLKSGTFQPYKKPNDQST